MCLKSIDYFLFMEVIFVAENNKDINHKLLVTGLRHQGLNLQHWELLLIVCETEY